MAQKRTAGKILIAVGAHPAIPECPGHEHGITSNEAFHLDAIPKRVLIAGAGYIANEFAGIFHQFGAHVTLINRSKEILRGYDLTIPRPPAADQHDEGDRVQIRCGVSRGSKRSDDGCLTVKMANHEPETVDLVMFATRAQTQHTRI